MAGNFSVRIRKSLVAFLVVATFYSLRTQSFSQDLFPASGKLVELSMQSSLSVFHPGSTGYLALTADIQQGWHINSNEPLDSYLIPTVLEFHAAKGIEILRIIYPAPTVRKLAISKNDMSLYDGTVVFGAEIRISKDCKPGRYPIEAMLSYQGCNDISCIEPARATALDTIRVGTLEEATENLATEIFSRPPFSPTPSSQADTERSSLDSKSRGDFGAMVKEKGLAFTFVMIFLAGIALNLTPCIYPLIPVTISYFGGQSGGNSGKLAAMAFLYVFGMSITYSALGTAAAMTGNLFGSALQHPLVIILISVVLLLLALSMFGFWEIKLPGFLATKTGKAKKGYLGALFMGLTMGLVAAPCIGPFVLGLLTYVGQTGNPLIGFLMFFALSWGIGSPFLVLGSISGAVARMPRSGHWMIWVRKIFGFVLIIMAIYFARLLLGAKLSLFLYASTSLFGGFYLSLLDKTPVQGRTFAVAKGASLVVGILAAVLLSVDALKIESPGNRDTISWQPFTTEALEAARREGKPVMLEFSADWCVPCHELDRKTFTDQAIVRLAARVAPLRVDLTKTLDREKEIKNLFSVRGVPTVIFIDSTGKEREDLRITGYIGPREFEKHLAEIVSPGEER